MSAFGPKQKSSTAICMDAKNDALLTRRREFHCTNSFILPFNSRQREAIILLHHSKIVLFCHCSKADEVKFHFNGTFLRF
jgi:hypothetical protein